MVIQGKDYEVIGHVKTRGGLVPIVDMPMMSDEEWQKGAIKNAVDNYIKKFGKEPESERIAVEWQEKVCAEMAAKHKGEKIRIDKDGRIIG